MLVRNSVLNVTAGIVIIFMVITFLFISGCSGTTPLKISHEDAAVLAAPKTETSIEKILTDALPGAGTGNRPIAVMVENSFAARPQSGLILADIVYEIVDEYGITRFVAIYSSNEAPVVGPVRSARTYYAEIARAFDPIYVFFGTYPQCYGYIESLGMYVLSAMSDRSGYSSITAQAPYWRDWLMPCERAQNALPREAGFPSRNSVSRVEAARAKPLCNSPQISSDFPLHDHTSTKLPVLEQPLMWLLG